MYAIELSDDGFWTLMWVLGALLFIVGGILFAKVR
jgi:hypothetical protein